MCLTTKTNGNLPTHQNGGLNMNIVSMNEYENEQMNFINKNGGLEKIDTSEMENNIYFKQYITKNGKIWYERINTKYHVSGKTLIDIYNVYVNYDTDICEIEFWNDDNGKSKFYYEN